MHNNHYRDHLAKQSRHNEQVERTLVRTGERWQRAQLRRDYTTMLSCERLLRHLAEENSLMWIAPLVARGQNNILKARGLNEAVLW